MEAPARPPAPETEYTGDPGREAQEEHARVARALEEAGERVEAGVERWYEVEAWLWLLLLVALLRLLDVPRRLFSPRTNALARWAALLLTLAWAAACALSARGDLLPRRARLTGAATTCGAVLTLVLPLLWTGVLFRTCGFPAIALAATGFMCVIMFPHIRLASRLRALLARARRRAGKAAAL